MVSFMLAGAAALFPRVAGPPHLTLPRHLPPRCALGENVVPTAPSVDAALVDGKVVPTAGTKAVPTAAPTAAPKAVPTATRRTAVSDGEYQRGLLTVAFITLLFASNSPALRLSFTAIEHEPPVLLLGAVASVAALSSLIIGGPLLNSITELPSTLDDDATDAVDATSIRAGVELGTWKYLGTSANLYGLSLTSAGHAAFLIQLTTLIVPLVQGLQGVPIPPRIWAAVGVALCGLALFTADPSAVGDSAQGDLACALAACCYAAYDLRLFVWGKRVTPLRLITTKVAAQAAVSVGALALIGGAESAAFLAAASPREIAAIAPLVLWSGVVVNGVAPFLQVGAQQAIGPARAQVVYASGPAWAALLSLVALGETVGPQGVVGGGAFLAAVLLAATAPTPDPNCDTESCEV